MNNSENYMANNAPQPEKWVNLYGDYLYRYAAIRVSDVAAAEDLVQDTFLSALKAYDNFKGQSSERTWFISILKHKIIDYYRQQSRSSKYFSVTETNEKNDDYNEKGYWKIEHAPTDWGDHPEEALQQREFLLILRECIKILPEKSAAVFMLREMEGLMSEDICKELGITSSNLWVMLHRARHRLRRCLEKNWFAVETENIKDEESQE